MKIIAEVQGNWEEQKSKLKQKFALLTGSNSMIGEGNKEEIIGQLQISLGKTKEQIDAIIAAL